MTSRPSSSVTGPWWLRLLARWPLSVFRGLGVWMAACLWLCAVRRRRVVERNLALCFPQASARQRARWTWETFRYFSQAFVDRVWLWHAPPEVVRQRVQLHDPHGVLAPHSPVVCFAPHFVGLDAGWAALTQQSAGAWQTVYARQATGWMDRWVRAGRSRFGRHRLVVKHEGFRPVIKGLREGVSLYVLPDMDLGARDSVFVPFFGVQTATVTSLSRLSKATGVPVVMLVTSLVPGGYWVEVGPRWAHFPSGDDVADAARMNAELEPTVRQMPGQYHWLHRRFKTRPPGESDVYGDRRST